MGEGKDLREQMLIIGLKDRSDYFLMTFDPLTLPSGAPLKHVEVERDVVYPQNLPNALVSLLYSPSDDGKSPSTYTLAFTAFARMSLGPRVPLVEALVDEYNKGAQARAEAYDLRVRVSKLEDRLAVLEPDTLPF